MPRLKAVKRAVKKGGEEKGWHFRHLYNILRFVAFSSLKYVFVAFSSFLIIWVAFQSFADKKMTDLLLSLNNQ
jgi:hypothetical protein